MAGSGPGDQCCSEHLSMHVAALVFSFLCPPSQGQNSWSEAVGVSISIMGGHIARVLMPCERTKMLFLLVFTSLLGVQQCRLDAFICNLYSHAH